jgi:hypothetical protein
MINPLRQFFSVTLVLSLLSANGLYFAPLLNVIRQSSEESVSMQKCCCCNSGSQMTSNCCCASRHSAGNDRSTCSIAAAPCATPVAVLSPNILDQWIDPAPRSNEIINSSTTEKFLGRRESLLPGIVNSLFHPPQSFFSHLS